MTSASPSTPEPVAAGASAATAAPAPAQQAAGSTPAQTRAGAQWPNWIREPLLHFLVLGALVFVADHLLASRGDDPGTIVVSRSVDQEARDTFKAARGREPNEQELAALRRVWLDNEVLYREGLALQLDKGDSAIRERIIFKSLSVVDASVHLPKADDAALRAWFEAHRDKYDEPARFDFEEAVLAGDNSEAAVRAFVATLNAQAKGETDAGLRVFKGRPNSNLVLSYGADFAKDLAAAKPGEWRAYKTREGWRAMRLEAVTSPKAAQYDSLRNLVVQDWTDATLSEQRSAAVKTLASKYKIRFEGDAK